MVNIKTDSRKVKKGDIFVALRGIVGDGHDFIPQAIKNGASKIIAEEGEYKVPYEIVKDSREYLNDYLKDVGCYVNTDLFPGKICKNIDELIQGIQKNEVGNLEAFKNIFFEYQDGKNTKRVVELIYDILKKSL